MAIPDGHRTSVTPHKMSGSVIREVSAPASRNSQPPMDSPRQEQAPPPGDEETDPQGHTEVVAQTLDTTFSAHQTKQGQAHITSAAHQATVEDATTPVRNTPSSSWKKSTPNIGKPSLPVNRRLTFTSSPSQAKKLSVPPAAFERSATSPSPRFEPLRSKSPTPAPSENESALGHETHDVEDKSIAGSKADEESLASTSQVAPSFTAINAGPKSSPALTEHSTTAKPKTKNPTKPKGTPALQASPAPGRRRINPKDLPWDDKETLRLWEAHWDADGNEINRGEVGLFRANAHRLWREANGYGNAHRNWITLDERMEDVLETDITLDELRARVEEGERQGLFPPLPEPEEVPREKTFAEKAEASWRKSKTPTWKGSLGARKSTSGRSTPAEEASVTTTLLAGRGSKALPSFGKSLEQYRAPEDEGSKLDPPLPLSSVSKDAAPTKKKPPAKRRAPDADILDQAMTPALLSTPTKRAKKTRLAPAPDELAGDGHHNIEAAYRESSPVTDQEELAAMAYFHQARLVLRKHCKEVFDMDGRAFDVEVAKWAGEYFESFKKNRPKDYAAWERGKKARESVSGKDKEAE